MRRVKQIFLGLLAVVALAVTVVGIYVALKVSAFNASMDKVYDIPLPTVTRSTDPAVLARGKHLTEAIAPCSNGDCHGKDMSGGKTIEIGPIGRVTAPNITSGGLGAAYSDAELARLIQHGVKKDGRTVRLMPMQEVTWLSDADVAAMVSYLRTVPAVDKPNGPTEVGVLGKVLDQRNEFPMDVARRIDHTKREVAPDPTPTADYGKYLARLCSGCHGEQLSGGKIPGAPPSIPIPPNLTPHETGLKDWTYEDFDKLLTTGVRKSGKQLNPFMPYESYGKMEEVEKKALFAYLKSAPAVPFGNR
jgi:cytochrome c553